MDNLTSFAGGLLIGLAATVLFVLTGRIAGNSGILAHCLQVAGDGAWRPYYVGGLLGGAALYRSLFPDAPGPTYAPCLAMLAAGGVLVGFGTRLGRGCTSGHGVCGIGRLSVRSVAATLVFMATSMITVWVVRRLGGAWW